MPRIAVFYLFGLESAVKKQRERPERAELSKRSKCVRWRQRAVFLDSDIGKTARRRAEYASTEREIRI
jgi:hypothetical protein